MPPKSLKSTAKPAIYLAGPINGCNHRQAHGWRDVVKHEWSDRYRFIDPTTYVRAGERPSEIVERDYKHIERSVAVLANMWKESIGTAMGVLHASRLGKLIVIADPNHIESQVLGYYADAVQPTVKAAMSHLSTEIAIDRQIDSVVKRDGTEQKFDREKLLRSIREACHAAGKNDVLLPAAIKPRVLAALIETRQVRSGVVTAAAIKDIIWTVLGELRQDDPQKFKGIRRAWEKYASTPQERRDFREYRAAEAADITVHKRPLEVRVHCGKPHGTVWGKTVGNIKDIPVGPRAGFLEICRVEGIAEIRITQRKKGPTTEHAQFEILASKTPRIIEGRCFHSSKKGDIQQFQIRVHDADKVDEIRVTVQRQLHQAGLLRGRRR